MTHDLAPTTPACDTALRAVIANTTMYIRVISQGENPVIQPYTQKVISQADARPFPLVGEPWQGHCLFIGRPGTGNEASDNGNHPSANHTGAVQ